MVYQIKIFVAAATSLPAVLDGPVNNVGNGVEWVSGNILCELSHATCMYKFIYMKYVNQSMTDCMCAFMN